MPWIKSGKKAQKEAQRLADELNEAILICVGPRMGYKTRYLVIAAKAASDAECRRWIDCKWPR